MIKYILPLFAILQIAVSYGQELTYEREELIPFGDMNSWTTRTIEESGIIGGALKDLYEIAPNQMIKGNNPYHNMGGSPWATSNVYARVAGISKTNCSVFPDFGIEGRSAKLMTRIEKVKVLGVVNISVIAAGSVFLGSIIEPIRGTGNPQAMLDSGIPFAKSPKAIRYDYKTQLSGASNRLRITGFSPKKEVAGIDMPMMVLLLQKRWEDSAGNIHASRVGTIVVNYTASSDGWQKDATYPIIYGDATLSSQFIPAMALGHEQRYALNSRGVSTPILEESWASEGETPTHIVLQFASSHGGAYIGSPGNVMWVDNVRLLY